MKEGKYYKGNKIGVFRIILKMYSKSHQVNKNLFCFSMGDGNGIEKIRN